jgi:hypothetical protein
MLRQPFGCLTCLFLNEVQQLPVKLIEIHLLCPKGCNNAEKPPGRPWIAANRQTAPRSIVTSIQDSTATSKEYS